jgi:hypothetical protein
MPHTTFVELPMTLESPSGMGSGEQATGGLDAEAQERKGIPTKTEPTVFRKRNERRASSPKR